MTAGLSLILSAAGATGAPPTVVAKLAQTGEVSCRPALPFFCDNIHVSCSGQTLRPAFAFTLRAGPTSGSIDATADAAEIALPYANARVEWGGAGEAVILFAQRGGGYIRLLDDGSYSLRHYLPQGGIMSRGHCE